MRAILKAYCDQDQKFIGETTIDTADLPEAVQNRINKLIWNHRKDCPYYAQRNDDEQLTHQ